MIPIPERVLALLSDELGEVSRGERATILRRRYGKTLRDASMATGIREAQLSEMERGIIKKVAREYVQYLAGLGKP